MVESANKSTVAHFLYVFIILFEFVACLRNTLFDNFFLLQISVKLYLHFREKECEVIYCKYHFTLFVKSYI